MRHDHGVRGAEPLVPPAAHRVSDDDPPLPGTQQQRRGQQARPLVVDVAEDGVEEAGVEGGLELRDGLDVAEPGADPREVAQERFFFFLFFCFFLAFLASGAAAPVDPLEGVEHARGDVHGQVIHRQQSGGGKGRGRRGIELSSSRFLPPLPLLPLLLAARDAQQRRDQAPRPGPDVEHSRRVGEGVRLVPEGRGERRAGGLSDALEALLLCCCGVIRRAVSERARERKS